MDWGRWRETGERERCHLPFDCFCTNKYPITRRIFQLFWGVDPQKANKDESVTVCRDFFWVQLQEQRMTVQIQIIETRYDNLEAINALFILSNDWKRPSVGGKTKDKWVPGRYYVRIYIYVYVAYIFFPIPCESRALLGGLMVAIPSQE